MVTMGGQSGFPAPPVTDRESDIVEGDRQADRDESLSIPFTGFVPRVQPIQSHRQFVEATQPEQVMCKIIHARQLLKRGETAETYFPVDVEVITTTTIRDGKLDALSWTDNGYRMGELEIVEKFGPDYHIPTDYSAYVDQLPEKRRELQKRCMKGTILMDNKLADTGTEIIPLFKGVRPESRQICYRTWDHIDADIAAYYATTYFTAAGRRTDRLVHDLEIVAGETDVPVLVIGAAAPRTHERLSGNVVAAAGQKQWRDRLKPTKSTATELRETYNDFTDTLRESMDLPTGSVTTPGDAEPSLTTAVASEHAPR